MGPYDLEALRTSFSSGALSDQDKYKVLKQFDQPQGYRFPAVSEGGQLRRFQATWFVNYPWLAYSKSESGGYCACCMAFASSIRTGGKFGALVESPLTKFKKALETLASHEKTEYHKDSYTIMVAFLESASKGQSVVSIEYLACSTHSEKEVTEMMQSTLKTLTLILVSTIPVTSCEAECTFSALRRLKPFLKTTMGENRLSSLTLLHVHRNVAIDLEYAVDRYARLHTRKLQFL